MNLPRLELVKTLIKSSLDNCLSPGTLTGTEIMLFYLSHWKRKISFLARGAFHLIIAEPDLFKLREISAGTEARVEGIEHDQVSGAPGNTVT